ncbi:MAG: acyl carrier protein [Janthinobacterium lividum]
MSQPLTDRDIAAECITAIAASKGIPRESVTLDSSLETLELDSLDRVSLSFDLEEKYGIEIAEHRLHSIVTVRDLVGEIRSSLAAKEASSVEKPQP